MAKLRYIIARAMIHGGLQVMPPGRVRQELTQLLWAWRLKVDGVVAGHTKHQEPT